MTLRCTDTAHPTLTPDPSPAGRGRKRIARIFLPLALLLAPAGVSAATLSIIPSSSSVTAGSAITLAVFVSSPDQAINAVSGELSFPAELLSVSSVSKANSILALWVQDPSYSNTEGTVQFSGGVPNPGFAGARGRIVTIQFKAKRPGAAAISFASSEVLANDGSGTNVLTAAAPATITVRPSPAPEAEEAPKPKPKPAAEPAPPKPAPIAAPAPVPVATSAVFATPEREQLITVETGLFPQWLKTGWVALNYLSLALIVIALAAALIFAAWYLSHRFRLYRRRVLKRLAYAEEQVHAQFEELRQTVIDEVNALERVKSKRALTAEETRIIRHLKRIIDKTEQAIEREIETAAG